MPVRSVALVLLLGTTLAAQEVPNLTGSWKLNPSRSDDAVAKIEEVAGPEQVKLLDAADVAVFYFGRDHVREITHGAKLRCHSYFKGPQLVIEQTGEKIRTIQVLTLLPGGEQMVQAVRFESPFLKQPLELRRIYDRSTGGW